MTAAGRVYRRTIGTRILGGACALLFGGGAISVLLSSGPTTGFFVLLALAILSLFNLAGAWADLYVLDDNGIEYRNAVLARLGRRPRRVAWEDVIEVREHRRLRAGSREDQPSAVFLILRAGGRLPLDSLQDFDEILKTVRHHCGAGGQAQ
jgi:hypothetical protein